MRISRLRLQDFRGWSHLDLCPRTHVLLAGVPRAGRSDVIADKRLAEIFTVAASTGDDPELDTLILRLHAETACRRGGALALRPCDLDANQSLVMLREKGDTTRWQPISPTLMRHLLDHADARGADPSTRLLRYRNGRPITARRYDYLWARVRQQLPWAAAQQVSAHWLRHTTLTWVERRFGYAVARAYAGHTDSGNAAPPPPTYAPTSTRSPPR